MNNLKICKECISLQKSFVATSSTGLGIWSGAGGFEANSSQT